MKRKRFEWKLRSRSLPLGDRTLLMGIVNVTPDSFSDGGHYLDPDRAYARAMELEDAGADIIDIGAESTRPGSTRLPEAEELRRLMPVLHRLRNKLTIPISVDTYKSGVAKQAAESGAEIINDPSGLLFDPQVARVAANNDAGLVLNHMRGTPETWAKLPSLKDPGGTVLAELDATIHRAVRSGVERTRIVIDPGIGFGKRKEQNSELIGRLPEFAVFGLPILLGPSRKSFLAQETERGTLTATACAVTAAIMGGAHIVRVHDLEEMKVAAHMADAFAAFLPEPAEQAPLALPPDLIERVRRAATENGRSLSQQAAQFIEIGMDALRRERQRPQDWDRRPKPVRPRADSRRKDTQPVSPGPPPLLRTRIGPKPEKPE